MLGCARASRPPGRGSEPGAALLPTRSRRSSPSAAPASSVQGSLSPGVGSRRNQPVCLSATRVLVRGRAARTAGYSADPAAGDGGAGALGPQPLLARSALSTVRVSQQKPPPPPHKA